MNTLTLRHLRLASGATMWCYIALHFFNHSLGLISLDAAEAALRVAAAVWQSWPGTVILYGAFGVHVVLALTALHQRHTLALPPLELIRIVFGLTIPLLLFGHVVSTRVAHDWYGEAAQYQRVVANLVRDGATGWQLALLAPGWLHGCMGLNVALRHRPWFQRARPLFISIAVALPLCAAAGYWSLTRDILALDANVAWHLAHPVKLDGTQRAALGLLRERMLFVYLSILGLVLVSRSWQRYRRKPA